MNLEAALAEGLDALGLVLDAQARARLIAYVRLLEKWNRTYNLTAIHGEARMLTHHILDSLATLPYVVSGRLLDVGSGGGLPGIPLAIAQPDLQVTLLDASQKKAAFMQQAAIELGLSRQVEARHGRVEAFRPADPYPQIVSRAFSDLSEFVALTRPLLAPGGVWLAMKGVYPNEEVAQLRGARVVRDVALQVPGLEAQRHLILMEAVA